MLLAEALKDTPKLRSLRRAFDLPPEGDDFPQRLSEVTASYSPLRSHPLLLGVRLNQLPATDALLESERDEAWLEDAVEAGTTFQVLIEFLRSRLPGYPIMRLPHLRDGSPHVFDDPMFIRGFPWDAEFRRLGLQRGGPPDMSPLGGGDCQKLLSELLTSIQVLPGWRRFAAAHLALSEDERRALSELAKQFAADTDADGVTDHAGDRLIARFHYRCAALDKAVNSAEGAVAEYLSAFEAVDELITVVAAVMETLMVSDGLLVVEPYRCDIGQGEDFRPVVLATRGDDPFHNPGEVLLVSGPHPGLSGLVYPTAITHRWGRSDDPDSSRMIVTGKFAVGSGSTGRDAS